MLWAVATLTFFAIHLVPGDPAQAILGGPGSQASQEALDRVRADYGLDQPLVVQYGAMLGRLAVGDLDDKESHDPQLMVFAGPLVALMGLFFFVCGVLQFCGVDLDKLLGVNAKKRKKV